MTVNKVQENRVRRIAKRRGFILKRSKRRDRQALDYDHYWLFDLDNALVYPRSPQQSAEVGTDLDDLEVWLNGYVRK
jgi:hypothetical protein